FLRRFLRHFLRLFPDVFPDSFFSLHLKIYDYGVKFNLLIRYSGITGFPVLIDFIEPKHW
ncbi:hypothetical protein, partial [Mariniphaga sp.]|uniref:hypothetical protein n=1 Tax=Mariniphaga sp. TaxID=1954475 RepID=UPI0035667107